MLVIDVVIEEAFDQEKQEFMATTSHTLTLEHSLVSLSKWESFFEKPFLGPEQKTSEETFHYIKAMVQESNVPEKVYEILLKSEKNLVAINDYINSKQTATWFTKKPDRGRPQKVITAEVIYHWMIALQIPFECQNWHLNRLMTLIQVCNEMNAPQKKMSKNEIREQHRRLNAERRARLKTSG